MRDLFDVIDDSKDADESQEDCTHRHEEKTETWWPFPGETTARWTWTCTKCGRVRGRTER